MKESCAHFWRKTAAPNTRKCLVWSSLTTRAIFQIVNWFKALSVSKMKIACLMQLTISKESVTRVTHLTYTDANWNCLPLIHQVLHLWDIMAKDLDRSFSRTHPRTLRQLPTFRSKQSKLALSRLASIWAKGKSKSTCWSWHLSGSQPHLTSTWSSSLSIPLSKFT